jgi:bacillithiol synthase
MGRPFLASLLAGDPAARGLLARDFRDGAARAAHVRQAARRAPGAALIAELTAQQAALPGPAPAREANLRALAAGGAAAVITGQQVGLFLGPLYTFYKAASAVAVARALEAEAGVRCVPVFWLQTEDHDFDEIAVAHVLGADGEGCSVRVAPDPARDARSSIAHRLLGPDVNQAVEVLAGALAAAPAAGEVTALLAAHYRPGVSPGQAFAGVLAQLFADDGLLVFDPRTPAVARLAAPLYRRALEQHAAIGRALAARKAALQAGGFAEQVPSREGCALVFFHDGAATGPRFRLEHAGTGEAAWTLGGGGRAVGAGELAAALADDPLRFSTSALLRPLVQDTLFPTAAYVGGPAEVAYFAQLGPLYELYDLPQPLVVPRARFRCVDGKARRLLDKLGLTAADLEQPPQALARKLAAVLVRAPAGEAPDAAALAGAGAGASSENAATGLPDPAALAAEAHAALAPVLARLQAAAVAADATLARPAARTGQQMQRWVNGLCDKYALAVSRRDATTNRRLDHLRALLCPGGVPQERHYGWHSLAARSGQPAFARAVAAALAPFAATVKDIEL